MKLHKNQYIAILEALKQIFEEGHQADRVVPKVLRSHRQWGSRDRRLVAAAVYDIVRYKRLYAYAAGLEDEFAADGWELIFLSWAVDVELPFPEWLAHDPVVLQQIGSRLSEGRQIRKLRESVPDWIDSMGEQELGSRWDKEIAALNIPAEVAVRTNTLKTTPTKLQRALKREQILTRQLPDRPLALVLENRGLVTRTRAYREGWCEVQDPSSQSVGLLVAPQPGMKVIDACAGAGGKTLQLGAMMENNGRLVAMDIHQEKLDELQRRCQRNGLRMVESHLVHDEIPQRFIGWADRVLIDAPCTGTGTWRRKADGKWKLEPDFLETVREIQAQILSSYSGMVKKGGKLIYATCSILPSENERQIEAFLLSPEGREFELEQEQTLYPSECGFDGFYMASLLRK